MELRDASLDLFCSKKVELVMAYAFSLSSLWIAVFLSLPSMTSR